MLEMMYVQNQKAASIPVHLKQSSRDMPPNLLWVGTERTAPAGASATVLCSSPWLLQETEVDGSI
jgi:hypothetical protein